MILRSARLLRPPLSRSRAPVRQAVRPLSCAPVLAARKPVSIPSTPLGPPPSSTIDPPSCGPEHEPFDRGIPYRRALLLFTVPVPPASWPSHIELASPLLGDAQFALKSKKIGVNVLYDGKGTCTSFSSLSSLPAELVFPDGTSYSWPHFTSATLDDPGFLEKTNHVSAQPSGKLDPPSRVLVCTHGSRDCRCHDRGVPLVKALRERGMQAMEIGHVGGHKWAANAITLPGMDMFSNLDAGGAEAFVRFLKSGGEEEGGMWRHWRGRFGYNELTQMRLAMQVERRLAELPPATSSPDDAESSAAGTSASATASPPNAAESSASASRKPAADPAGLEGLDIFGGLGGSTSAALLDPKALAKKYSSTPRVPLRFRTHSGQPIEAQAPLGSTLLEVAKLNSLPGMEGTCGGNCECATCHLYLGPGAPVPEPGEEEEDMLFTAVGYREGESRLGCQVRVSEELGRWNDKGGEMELPQY